MKEEIAQGYQCGSCNKNVPLRIERFILHAPEVLILNLKRYSSDPNKTYKNGDLIKINPIIYLDPYIMRDDNDEKKKGETFKYSLYAIVEHAGETANSGHYMAYVKSGQEYM